jgi:hypothetical protein
MTSWLYSFLVAAISLNLAAAVPLQALDAEFPGFTVCGAGDPSMNGFYSQVDSSEFQLNTSTFEHKNMLFFDAVPLPNTKGPYGWELYSYTLLKKPVTKYFVCVADFVDPPQRGWAVYGSATAPAPVVLKGNVPCTAQTATLAAAS